MKDEVNVSVIIPVYNSERTAQKLLESILKQDYTNFELIVVDDGSSDQSMAIANAYVDRFAYRSIRLQIISISNSGQFQARNVGIAAAVGKFISFIDGDDWIESNHISQLVEAQERNDADLVCTNYFLTSAEGRSFSRGGAYSKSIDYSINDFLPLFLSDKVEGFLWNKLFRAEMLKNNLNSGHQPKFNYMEDVITIAQLLPQVRLVSIGNVPTYHYVQSNFSAVHRSTNIRAVKGFESAEEALSRLNDTFGGRFFREVEFHYIKGAIALVANIDYSQKHEFDDWLNRCVKRFRNYDFSGPDSFNLFDRLLIRISGIVVFIPFFKLRKVLVSVKHISSWIRG